MAPKLQNKKPKLSKRSPQKIKSRFLLKPSYLLLLLLPLLIWFGYRSLVNPSQINLVGETTYDDTRCVRVSGSCLNPTTNSCVSYTNECEGMRLCGAIPWKACDPAVSPTPAPSIPPNCLSWFDGCNTCTVKNGILLGCTKKACKLDVESSPKCVSYSPDTPPASPTPVPSGCQAPKPSCTPDGACTQSALYYCPSPTPMGTPTSSYKGLSSFTAKKPCGVASFLDYTFACDAGQEEVTTTSNSECRPFEGVYKQAVVYCGGKI